MKNPQVLGTFKLFAELIAYHLDTEERLRATAALLESEREIAELREQFIAVLGHDLRNPIAALNAGTSRLMKEGWTEHSPDSRCRVELGLFVGCHRQCEIDAHQRDRLFRDRRQPCLYFLRNAFRPNGRSHCYGGCQGPCPDQFDLIFFTLRHVTQMVAHLFQVNEPVDGRRGTETDLPYPSLLPKLSIKMLRKALTAGLVRRLSGQTAVML